MNIEDVLQKLGDIRQSFVVKMIAGTCGGGSSVQNQMVNYRAAVIACAELGKVIGQIETSMKKETDAAEAALEPQDEPMVEVKDAYEEEA